MCIRDRYIAEAIYHQAQELEQVIFADFTHPQAELLAKRLSKATGLERLFFSDNGSTAVEVAIKLALQWWHNQGEERQHIIAFEGAYHGDTFGAMSVCDPIGGMHTLFKGFLAEQIFSPQPTSRFGDPLSQSDAVAIQTAVQDHAHEIAAIIVEPIVQGAGGMWFYSSDFLCELERLCKAHDILLIFDEIATGFGRTGKMFASEHANVSPDIMCLGKALTGGYLSQAATLTNERIATGISQNGGVLMHGPTFMANPTAAVAAIASIDLLMESDWSNRVLSLIHI